MASLVRSFASTRSAVLFVVAAASLAACHKKKPAPAPTPTTTTFNEDSARRAQAYADSVRRAQELAKRSGEARVGGAISSSTYTRHLFS